MPAGAAGVCSASVELSARIPKAPHLRSCQRFKAVATSEQLADDPTTGQVRAVRLSLGQQDQRAPADAQFGGAVRGQATDDRDHRIDRSPARTEQALRVGLEQALESLRTARLTQVLDAPLEAQWRSHAGGERGPSARQHRHQLRR